MFLPFTFYERFPIIYYEINNVLVICYVLAVLLFACYERFSAVRIEL